MGSLGNLAMLLSECTSEKHAKTIVITGANR